MTSKDAAKAAAASTAFAGVAAAMFATVPLMHGDDTPDVLAFFLGCWFLFSVIFLAAWGFVLSVWFASDHWGAWSDTTARERERHRRCRICGYDLTGNLSGVCPECGKPTASAKDPGSKDPASQN